jgi:hypothetical protein
LNLIIKSKVMDTIRGLFTTPVKEVDPKEVKNQKKVSDSSAPAADKKKTETSRIQDARSKIMAYRKRQSLRSKILDARFKAAEVRKNRRLTDLERQVRILQDNANGGSRIRKMARVSDRWLNQAKPLTANMARRGVQGAFAGYPGVTFLGAEQGGSGPKGGKGNDIMANFEFGGDTYSIVETGVFGGAVRYDWTNETTGEEGYVKSHSWEGAVQKVLAEIGALSDDAVRRPSVK